MMFNLIAFLLASLAGPPLVDAELDGIDDGTAAVVCEAADALSEFDEGEAAAKCPIPDQCRKDKDCTATCGGPGQCIKANSCYRICACAQ